MDEVKIAEAASMISASRNVVALTGAGISRPSGIPDFRSVGGMWEQENPMEVASRRTFDTNPQRFYNWLRPLLQVSLAAQPNPAHLALAELERLGILKAVVTQNIDGLHQRAGSRTVYELHGHMRSATCISCEKQVASDALIPQVLSGKIPLCDCGGGGTFKPDVVLFDEFLPMDQVELAQQALFLCDVLLVVGTSLEVSPVADMPLIAMQRGARVIIVNMMETYLDGHANIVLHEDVAAALPAIMEHPAFRYYE